MAEQDLPEPRARSGRRAAPDAVGSPRGDRIDPGDLARRRSSMGTAERIFDVMMMILFGVLGLILIVLAVLLHSTLSIVGGGVVLAAVIPLWLGGGGRGGRHTRRLGWYPVAVLALIVGLVLWVHPWA